MIRHRWALPVLIVVLASAVPLAQVGWDRMAPRHGTVTFTQNQLTGPKFMDEFLGACRTMDHLNRFLAKAMNVEW